MGGLVVYTGPMYAGKSGELIEHLESRDSFRAFKPIIDDRYGEEQIITHDGMEVPATPVETGEEGMDALLDLAMARDPEVVGIDEGQFFDNSLVNAVVALKENGYDVAVAGLNEDFRGEPFEPVPTLAEMADEVEILQARCDRCGSTATKTQRVIDGEPAPYDSPQVVVAGEEKYEARCPECHEVPGKESSS